MGMDIIKRAMKFVEADKRGRQMRRAASEHRDAHTAGAIVRYRSVERTRPHRPTHQNRSGVLMQTSVAAYVAATPIAPQGRPATIEITAMKLLIKPQCSSSRV